MAKKILVIKKLSDLRSNEVIMKLSKLLKSIVAIAVVLACFFVWEFGRACGVEPEVKK